MQAIWLTRVSVYSIVIVSNIKDRMRPTTPPPDPPNDPEPQNPVPPPEPQPESTHSKIFAAQFKSSKSIPSRATAVAKQPAISGKGSLPSAFDLFRPSWEAVRRNLNSFLWLVLLPSLLAGTGSLLTRGFHKQHAAGGQLLSFIGVIYSLVVLAAVPLLSLLAARGHTVQPEVVFKSSWHFFWRLLGLYIVTAMVVLVGLLLLIIPGIIMIRRYYLAPYFLIDQDLEIVEAMRQSAAATKGHSGALWGVIGVQILLGLIGVIPAIGSIVVVFFELPYACAPAIRYLQLKELTAKTTT